MSLAERVERAILRGDPTTVAGRARLKAAIQARRILVRLGDPTVRYRVGAVELELPLSHELPFYQHDHPRYDRQLGAIAAELGGPVVDIGANVGDTAAAIRAESDVPILCVEGDARVLRPARAQRAGDRRRRARAARSSRARARSDRAWSWAPRTWSRVMTRFRAKPLAQILERAPCVREAGAAQARHGRDGRADPAREPRRCSSELRPVLFFEYDPHLGADARRLRAPPRDRLRDRGRGTRTPASTRRRSSCPAHLHEDYVGHGGARYADVCVRPR